MKSDGRFHAEAASVVRPGGSKRSALIGASGRTPSARSSRSALCGKAALALAIFVAAPAEAGPLSVYGYNPRGVAMGEAMAAAASDGSAAYHNPALLSRADRSVLGMGFQYVLPFVYVEPEEWTFDEDDSPVLPADFLQWNLDVLFPLGGKLRNKVAFGLSLSLPHGYIVRIESIDGGRPQFPIYQSSAQKLTLIPALSVRPVDWLSLGVGIQNLSTFVGGTDINIDLFARRVLHRSMLVDFLTHNALVAGVAVGPFAGVTLGLSYRQEIGLDYILPADLDIEDVGRLQLRLKGIGLWSPHELTAGLAVDLPAWRTILSFDLTWGRWSAAPSPQAMTVIETSGEVLEGLGLEGAFDLCSDREVYDEETGTWTCVPLSPGYADNLVPKLGLEVRPTEALALRAGYRYWPTPVPNQRGRTNYLDASSHHLSLGLGYSFRDPLEIMSRPVTLEMAGHAVMMREREVEKGDDGGVAYRFGGTMLQTTAAFRYRF